MYNIDVMFIAALMFWVSGLFFIRWSIKNWWMRRPSRVAFVACGVGFVIAAILASITAIAMALGY